jgi:hypothetical protein
VPGGPTIFTWYHPLCDRSPRQARTELLGRDWQSCADLALTDLRRPHPEIDTLVERVDVMRWGHAMIRPRVGFVWGSARAAAMKPYRGVHFAHSDLSGIALFEEAFCHGVRAADEVLASPRMAIRGLGKPNSRVRLERTFLSKKSRIP